MSKVLTLSLRPQNLDELIGQDEIVKTLKNQFESGRIPHFFIISGASGTGKTTLSRILALMLQEPERYKAGAKAESKTISYSDIKKYDIREINASDKNGIDDIRNMIENMKMKPFQPSIAKIFILDEAHQLTTPAQNALLAAAEDTPDHVYFIFCTNQITKLLATLKRRAYIIDTNTLEPSDIGTLLQNAKDKTKSDRDMAPLEEVLITFDITSPGFILQAAEKYINGAEPLNCISSSVSNLDTQSLCRLVLKGIWKDIVPVLKNVKKEDIFMVRNCVLGYLKSTLLGTLDKKASGIAQAIKIIGESPLDDLPMFLANICLACDKINPPKVLVPKAATSVVNAKEAK